MVETAGCPAQLVVDDGALPELLRSPNCFSKIRNSFYLRLARF